MPIPLLPPTVDNSPSGNCWVTQRLQAVLDWSQRPTSEDGARDGCVVLVGFGIVYRFLVFDSVEACVQTDVAAIARVVLWPLLDVAAKTAIRESGSAQQDFDFETVNVHDGQKWLVDPSQMAALTRRLSCRPLWRGSGPDLASDVWKDPKFAPVHT